MKTYLDWSAYADAGMGDAYADIPRTGGDFAKAVSVCINSRQCETLGKGVMCPSYRISADPNLAPGGRVRLLKAALNGEPATAAFDDPALFQAMDLCVACKGCKRECENAVDMALIKVEYLAQLNAESGLSLRARLLAGLPVWLHRQPWLGRLIAWRNRRSWLARAGERLLGIAARRRLPEPAAAPFIQPSRKGQALPQTESGPESAGEVVLFVDTFSRYFEPDIADAAVTVLESTGYRVSLAQPASEPAATQRPLCCGRTFLSHGMVGQARAEAGRVLAALLPHAQAGRPIVVLEPSCLTALRDDYHALGLGEATAVVARQTLLLEEFLAREHAAQRLALQLKAHSTASKRVLVHGHCHQKAVGAMKSMRKVLKLVPDLAFEFVETSCCGMAGGFGVEAEHADQAMAMAEQSLLPTLRAAPDAAVLANGFACRMQIRQGSGHRPRHLAVWLRDALASGA